MQNQSHYAWWNIFPALQKKKRSSKKIFCRGVQVPQQAEGLLCAISSDPPPNQRRYSAIRIHLHKQENYMDELQATYCEPPERHATKTVWDQQWSPHSQVRKSWKNRAAQQPRYHQKTPYVALRVFPTLFPFCRGRRRNSKNEINTLVAKPCWPNNDKALVKIHFWCKKLTPKFKQN